MSILERPQGRNYFSSEMVSQGPSYDNVFFKKVYNTEIGVTHTHTHTHTHRGDVIETLKKEYLGQSRFRMPQKLSRSEGLS